MNKLKYFLDFEFIENGRTIDPISLGIVCEDGRELYLEFKFDESACNDWVRKNVLPKLRFRPHERVDRKDARKIIYDFVINDFLGPVNLAPRPVFWGYYSDYDWVCFAQIWGRMIDLPAEFPMFCMDLMQWWEHLGRPDVKPEQKNEHNALDDARWNRDFWDGLDCFEMECY